MKRISQLFKFSLCLFLACLLSSDAMATRNWGRRSKSTTLKFGYFNPKGAKSGASFGLNLSSGVDETVDMGFSVDLFHRSYQRDSEVARVVSEGGVVESQIQRDMDFSTTAIPIMGTFSVKLSPDMPFSYFIGGGLGYALMWNKETNYTLDVSEKRFYHGFTWQLGGGIMYQLGSRSHLVGEVFYNDAHVKRDKGKTANGLPVWTEVDLSGVAFRLGIRIGR